MEQQSKAWHEWRAKGLGSSDIAAVLGVSSWMTPYQCYLYKTGQAEQPDLAGSWAVQRGVENEGKARAQIELMAGESFEPCLVVHPQLDFMRASLDGRSKDGKTLIEIKIPGKVTFEAAERGELEDKYMAQTQHQLFCAPEAERNIFFCFHPETGKHAQVTVVRDAKWQERIQKEGTAFWMNHVQKRVPPELTKKDFKKIRDAALEMKAQIYIDLKKKLAPEIEVLEKLENELKALTSEHAAILCGNLRIVRSEKRGAIDYSKIEALKNVDLEPYRKKSTYQVRITNAET